jgi:hypothetical protein
MLGNREKNFHSCNSGLTPGGTRALTYPDLDSNSLLGGLQLKEGHLKTNVDRREAAVAAWL